MAKTRFKSCVSLLIAMLLLVTSFPMAFSVSAAGECDLTITQAGKTTAKLYDGESTYLYAVIRNQSTEAAPKGAKVAFYVDGRSVQEVTCNNAIPAGGKVTVQTTQKRSMFFGTHIIKAIVNRSGEIAESDKSNNTVKVRMSVFDDENPDEPQNNDNIVINQVYGGGAKGATPFSNSFIELYNKGDKTVDLAEQKYKLEYVSSREGIGTGGEVISYSLTGTIPPHTSYLIRCAAETTDVAVYNIDKFDAEWNQVIDNKQYCISLVYGANGKKADAVSAVDADTTVEVSGEGSPAVGISKQTTVRRIGFADTDNNAKDFEVVAFKGAAKELIEEKRPRSKSDGAWTYTPPTPTEPHPSIEPNVTEVTEPEVKLLDAYEANVLNGAAKANKYKGYKGNGYVEQLTSGDRAVEFTYNAAEDGDYKITVRYANGSGGDKNGTITVNNSANNNLSFKNTKYWDSWNNTSVIMQLKKGENKIKISGNGGGTNIDSLSIYRSFDKKISSFTFLKSLNPELPEDIICDINSSGLISAKIPSDLDISYLIPTFNCDGTATVNGKVQESGKTANNYTNGHYYKVKSGDKELTYTVKLKRLKDKKLPNVYVRFDTSVVSNDLINRVVSGSDKTIGADCYFSVNLGEQSEIINATGDKFKELDEQAATIKLRGNSTLHQPKKSWNIKFASKSKVLDMPSEKNWILLASYDDKSMMRQYLGYELGQCLNNTGYTPRTRYVNLFMNGKYNGVYLLMEKIKISKNRVNITSFEENYLANPDNPNYSGGYIMELDSRQANYNGDEPREVVFQGGNWWFTFKDPNEDFLQGDISNKAKQYMSDYFNKFRDSLNNISSGEYKKYIDMDSFVDWYLVMEITKNLDAAGNTSIFCYKAADTIVDGKVTDSGKLYMGPIWDFDISMGNMDYSDSCKQTSGWHIRNAFWYGNLFNDQEFVNAVKKRYTEWRNSGFDALDLIKKTGVNVDSAMIDNYEIWDYLDSYYWPEPAVLHSYSAYVNDLYNWVDARLKWMDTQLLIK